MKIGFIGLGQMGKHMAVNLVSCGEKVLVYDVKRNNYAMLEQAHAITVNDIQEIAACEIIFLSLPDEEVVKQVLLTELGGLLKAGQIIVDLSTIMYTACVEIGGKLAEQGVRFMDAPVSGMEGGAKEASLTIMCGGEKTVFDQVETYLKFMGANILYMGTLGAGQLTKNINNILFDINIAALAEILPMAVKLGLGAEKIGAVINNSSGRSFASEFFIPRILERHFGDGYPLAHAYKDMESGSNLGARCCIPLPITHAAATTYQMALLKGFGDEDKGAMIRVFEELLGVQFAKD